LASGANKIGPKNPSAKPSTPNPTAHNPRLCCKAEHGTAAEDAVTVRDNKSEPDQQQRA